MGIRRLTIRALNSDTTSYNYGLRYAIIDMSLSGGLGSVVSKNNILFTNSPTNALTSTIASNNSSYWIVSANNGNFLSYRLTSNGLITTPVSSPAPHYGNFFKISPDSKKLLTRINLDANNRGIYLADFNNTTGSITNQNNIISMYQGQYIDRSDFANSAEFSENSNVIYFISSDICLCIPPSATSHIRTYNISTGMFSGYQMSGGLTGSLQRAVNGKVYMIQSYQTSYNSNGVREVIFGWSNANGNYSYNWLSFDNPNNSGPTYSTQIPPVMNTKNGYSFPQLVPHLDYVNTCPNDLDINYQITSSQNFQAGQSIIASSVINDGLTVNYKAGNSVTLLPGFYVKALENSLFHAYIGPCDGLIENFARNNNTHINSISKETKISSFDIKIFPNPTSTFINIDSGNEKITSWELFDISGRSILKGSSNQINVQGLPKTTYLLNININNKITTKKVIVK